MTYHLFLPALYRAVRKSRFGAACGEGDGGDGGAQGEHRLRVSVLLPVASWMSSHMARCPSVGLVGAPGVRLPARVTRKRLPSAALVAMVDASVNVIGAGATLEST